MRTRKRDWVGPVVTVGVGLACAGPAIAAASSGLRSLNVTEPAAPGLPVSGALSGFHVTSTVRVVVPAGWSRKAAPAGQLRLLAPVDPSCAYGLTYTVKSVLAPSQQAAAYAAGLLPAPGPRYLLDSGVRGNKAFRVVRETTTNGQVRVNGLWVGVLTKRADIAPAATPAWTQIAVTAVSQAGDECHSGTWRAVLGPAIGDSLAVARTGLHFTGKG